MFIKTLFLNGLLSDNVAGCKKDLITLVSIVPQTLQSLQAYFLHRVLSRTGMKEGRCGYRGRIAIGSEERKDIVPPWLSSE